MNRASLLLLSWLHKVADLRFLLLFLLLAGCSVPDNSDKMIFRYNESAGIATLDPAFAKDQTIIWGCTQLYNGLVALDEQLQPQPCIAKTWTISPDGLTYTFTLRDNVYFHKNELFTDSTRRVVAGDFVYSLRRLIDPSVASPGRWVMGEVDTFYAPTDSTFVIHLKQAFAPFLSLLGMAYCSVVPHEVVEHYGPDFREHPCGTGPFQFQYWKEGVKLVLRRNPLYFERDEEGTSLPYLDAVAVTFIVDKQTMFLEFVKGNLDFMNSLDASYKDELLTRTGELKEKYADRIEMVSTPFLNTEYLGFNMSESDSPLKDKRIRQAINCGFDREKMMRYLRNGIGQPGTGGMVPCGLPGFDTVASYGYRYDPDRATRLLAEAGYPGGKGLPSLTLGTTSNYLDLCKYIQQQLGLIGIDVKLDVNPPAALREQISQGKAGWFRGSWIADYPDAENYLQLFYSENRCPAGANYTRYSNARYDALYRRAKKTTDEEERIVLYHKMDSLIMEDAPVMVLYYDQILHFTHKNVTGLRSNAMNALDLRKVKIEN
ncbi:MAG: ABC transporter substrate-binding protein [Bacteroidales bacterium]|nr:ABC transporter substrate-binding protein [Bacteroidales bacterium]